MNALVMLFVCMALGMGVRRWARPPAGLARGLNWWVLYIALPAIVLELVPRVEFALDLWFPIVVEWLAFFGAWVLFAWLGRRRGWSRGRIGALVLVAGLGNTAFMGYPLVEALRGETALGIAVVADQLGSFPLMAIFAVIAASIYAGEQPDARRITRKVLAFPAFGALFVGLVVAALGGWPPLVDAVLHPIAVTLSPLALFSIGLQLELHALRRHAGALAAGLGWKLVIAPLGAFALGLAAGIDGLILSVGVLQVAMAPMTSAAILADEFDLAPELANSLLGSGILVSLVTVPLAHLLLP